MGKKDIRDDLADGAQEEGCAEDERRAGHGARDEGRDGLAGAEHRIQGAHGVDNAAPSGIQDGVQPILHRGLFPQGDRRHAGDKRDDIEDTAEQGEDLAAEKTEGK